MTEPIIEIKRLDKEYKLGKGLFKRKTKTIKAVDQLSFTISEGEVVGLIGESGSGKTTLARLLLGLTNATSGEAIIENIDMTKAGKMDKRMIRSNLAVVFQDPASNLNPRQTVESSIMRPMIINGVDKDEARKRANEAMVKVKMDPGYLKSYPHQLSGGQLQRIAIARALVLRPKIMILDEPTSALDISVQAQILNLLLDLQEEFDLTYLVVTHDLNVIRYISDRVAVMCLGKLVEHGPTDEVMHSPYHPYTKILMSSLPVMNPDQRHEEPVCKPEIVNKYEDAGGCRVFSRCEYRKLDCLECDPELVEVTEGHFSACLHVKS